MAVDYSAHMGEGYLDGPTADRYERIEHMLTEVTSVAMSVHISMHMSTRMSVHMSVHISVHISMHMSIEHYTHVHTQVGVSVVSGAISTLGDNAILFFKAMSHKGMPPNRTCQ